MTQERMKEVVEIVCKHLDLDVPSITLVDNKHGGAKRICTVDGATLFIDLPKAVISHGDALIKYYIVHECTHFAVNSPSHTKKFKEVEEETLSLLFNIGIKYSRMFPKYLYDEADPTRILWGTSEKFLGKGPCLLEKFI
jgi:hypothetical protein